jgi:hypothetical protein
MKKLCGFLTVFFIGTVCFAQQDVIVTLLETRVKAVVIQVGNQNKNAGIRYEMGDRGPAGGYIFYDKGNYSNGWRYLEAAPAEADFTVDWGTYPYYVSGTSTCIGSGKQNTKIIINYLRRMDESGKAAQLCESLNVNGYTDWFLPSRDELALILTNLKQKGFGGSFRNWYWSSSQVDATNSWLQHFDYAGSQYHYQKYYTSSVRPVRAF